jgi:hypothetical protein
MIEFAKAERVSHSSSGPDPAPNDFFFFRYLKEKLRRTLLTPSNDRSFAIQQIFSEIPEMILKNMLTN